MKQLLFTMMAALLISFSACNNTTKTAAPKEAPATAIASIQVIPVDSILELAPGLVDQEIEVIGHVTHTCKHSGKRCFLVGDNETFSMRVEAGGKITGFNRELVGNKLQVRGILKERRLSEEYLAQWEEKVKAQEQEEDGSAESCEAEMSNINSMREWMTANNKDYYSIFFLNGIDYEIVE
ncbi:MAG: hypothetical protein ACK5M7_06595 [Draconibacterium sp.]